jgi:outer membrane immunogenic protein
MRRVILAAVTAALSVAATAVSAQDILSAMYRPTPVASWTGFYVGGNFGYGWASADSRATSVTATSTVSDMNGLNAGGELGVNVQSGMWLGGMETDLQWAWQKGGGGTAAALFSSAGFGVPTNTSESDKVTWFGTTRARFGIVSGPLLIFGTGGVAYGQFKLDSRFGAGGSFASTSSRIGWAVGGGLETMLTRNWTVKAEYLHLDFGGFNQDYVVNGATVVTLHTRLQNEVLRVGVNYFFR